MDNDGKRYKVRIKFGAPIMQDFHFLRWPRCVAHGGGWNAPDSDMVFMAVKDGHGWGWECYADGYGFGVVGWPAGKYGNGSISVIDMEDVEILPDDTPVYRLNAVTANFIDLMEGKYANG